MDAAHEYAMEIADNNFANRYILDPINNFISDDLICPALLDLRERYPDDADAIYVYHLVLRFFQVWLHDKNRFVELRALLASAPPANRKAPAWQHQVQRQLNAFEVMDAVRRGINNEPAPLKLRASARFGGGAALR